MLSSIGKSPIFSGLLSYLLPLPLTLAICYISAIMERSGEVCVCNIQQILIELIQLWILSAAALGTTAATTQGSFGYLSPEILGHWSLCTILLLGVNSIDALCLPRSWQDLKVRPFRLTRSILFGCERSFMLAFVIKHALTCLIDQLYFDVVIRYRRFSTTDSVRLQGMRRFRSVVLDVGVPPQNVPYTESERNEIRWQRQFCHGQYRRVIHELRQLQHEQHQRHWHKQYRTAMQELHGHFQNPPPASGPRTGFKIDDGLATLGPTNNRQACR